MSNTYSTDVARTKPATPVQQSYFLNLFEAAESIEERLIGAICLHYDKPSGLRQTSLNIQVAIATGLESSHFSVGPLGEVLRILKWMGKHQMKVTPATLAGECEDSWAASSTCELVASCIREAVVWPDETLLCLIRKAIEKSHTRYMINSARHLSVLAGDVSNDPSKLATIYGDHFKRNAEAFTLQVQTFERAVEALLKAPRVKKRVIGKATRQG